MAEDRNADVTHSVARGLTAEEQKKRQQRNAVLALCIVGFVVIVFFVTLLRIGGSIAERAL